MIFSNLQKIWHYVKCILILRQEIGLRMKRNFNYFGINSTIYNPYLQLSGYNQIFIGDNTTILNNARLAVYGESNEISIKIGNGCYIGFGFSALSASESKIIIGDNVLFASNVTITNENHGINPESDLYYMNQPLSSSDVMIGDGCWIGEKVCILPGVTIGEKSVIGAGSVVTKSIPSYSIAVGNPARVIKKYNFEQKHWECAYEKNE